MRATIRDLEVLESIRPGDLSAYLRAKGWQQKHYSKGRSVWALGANGDSFEVLVPMDGSFRDYALRIGDVLRTLEQAEGRSQMAVVADVTTTFADTVRIAAKGRHRGSIGIDDGIALANHAREMLLASACAAEKPRPYYPPRKSDVAAKYAKGLELGQTERGSYVMTVLSPFTPTGKTLISGGLDEPFERRVTRTLVGSLSGAVRAAEQAIATARIDPFKEAVELGVSSNLCMAVSGLHEAAGGERLVIGVSWASGQPLSEPPPEPVGIGPETAEMIAAAGEAMAPKDEPRGEFRLVGVVVALRREEGAESGSVTVAGPVDGVVRKVVFNLEGATYHRAVTAHDNQSPVQVFGVLSRGARQFEIGGPHSFEIL